MKQTLQLLLFTLVVSMSWLVAAEFPVDRSFIQADPDRLDGNSRILPVDEALRFGSYHEDGLIKLFWQVMPGYFLYRDKIDLLRNGEVEGVELPEGVVRQDEIFGEVQVLDGLIELQLSFSPGENIIVRYQGCAAQGYCYPPQKKSLNSAK